MVWGGYTTGYDLGGKIDRDGRRWWHSSRDRGVRGNTGAGFREAGDRGGEHVTMQLLQGKEVAS